MVSKASAPTRAGMIEPNLQATYSGLDFAKGTRFTGDVSKAKDWIEG